MREACVSDIAAEFISIMELNTNEAHGLLDRLLARQPRQPNSGRRHRHAGRRRSGRKSDQSHLA